MENWFAAGLKTWYRSNKRDLPWRNEKDPYRIWLSEVILQQTQVAQGLAYYHRFTETFPRVTDLAGASEDEVLKLWQGLGYYSRARNLREAARTIVSDHRGLFPRTYNGIRALKGVGDYTAAAVASFAFDLPHAVVDGNVYRVLSRIFGLETPIDTGPGKKAFAALAHSLLDRKNPALHNQAIMEFGSQFCRPASPSCGNCPFAARCVAYTRNITASLPVKSKKAAVRDRHLNYLLLVDRNNSLRLNRRESKDIWKGLYEFTLFESARALSPEQLMASKYVKNLPGGHSGIKYVSGEYKHVLTHQHLYARFYVLRVHKRHPTGDGVCCRPEELNRFAFPRLIEKFLNDCDLKEIL